MGDSLVVGSKVKDAVRNSGCNCGGDFVDALSGRVQEEVKRAADRAKANGRKTVRANDL